MNLKTILVVCILLAAFGLVGCNGSDVPEAPTQAPGSVVGEAIQRQSMEAEPSTLSPEGGYFAAWLDIKDGNTYAIYKELYDGSVPMQASFLCELETGNWCFITPSHSSVVIDTAYLNGRGTHRIALQGWKYGTNNWDYSDYYYWYTDVTVPGECTTGEKRCDGNVLQSCVAEEWIDDTNCGSVGCDSALKTCFECVNGQEQCDSGDRVRCIGGYWDVIQACSPKLCNEISATSTSCSDCAPGVSSCADDKTLKYCNSVGNWMTQTCEVLCVNGVCTNAPSEEFDRVK
jgi:hypothetical protein